MKISNSIAVKIGVSFITVLLLTCLVGYIGDSELKTVTARADKLQSMSGIVKNLLEARRHEKNLILRRDRQYLDKALAATADLKQQARASRDSFAKESDRKLMDKVIQGAAEYEDALKRYTQIYLGPNANPAQLQELDRIMVMAARQAQESSETALKVQRQQMLADTASARRSLLLFTVSALILGGVLSVILTIRITRPVHTLVTAAQAIAGGDLTVKPVVQSKDEIGVLAEVINRMSAQLNHMVQEITNTADNVSSAASQLLSTAKQIADGSEELASQSATIATATEEMSATSGQIAENCQAAAQNAHTASSSAETGTTTIRTALSGMASIADKVKSIAESIEGLGARSDEIGQIIGTIEDIADQTNLLALNAAIEAARAGEQGRGFAVVADEVRALAERTTKATHEIGTMIKTIQKETVQAVNDINEGVRDVENGIGATTASSSTLQEIIERAARVNSQICQIATAVEEQAATTHDISSNLHQMSDVVRDSSRHAEETAASATQLSSKAVILQDLLRRFKTA